MNNINKILGENVRRHRKRLRMTQEQLAEKVDKSLGTIQLMESGKTWPELATIQILSKLFKVDDRELFESASDGLAEPPSQADPAPLRALLVAITRLNEDQLGILLDSAAELVALNERTLDRLNKSENTG